MSTTTHAMATALDKFDQCNNSLIFFTSAIRSMFETGNVNDPDVDIGIHNYLQTLTKDYQQLQETLQQCQPCNANNAMSETEQGLTNKNDKEQKT
jgi:hypothetical protein